MKTIFVHSSTTFLLRKKFLQLVHFPRKFRIYMIPQEVFFPCQVRAGLSCPHLRREERRGGCCHSFFPPPHRYRPTNGNVKNFSINSFPLMRCHRVDTWPVETNYLRISKNTFSYIEPRYSKTRVTGGICRAMFLRTLRRRRVAVGRSVAVVCLLALSD